MSLQAVVNFQVIDESDDWIVVNKPAPLIVHPANQGTEPTLLGGLERLLAYEIENGARLGIVTRLDRDTSGLVLVAKHYAAARELGLIFQERRACKQYFAIVRGWPESDAWTCREPLIRASEVGPSEIWVRQQVHPQGRESLTHFSVESRFERSEGKFAVVRCLPHTGRMHQIRVHLVHAGFPVAGDKIYAGDGSEYLDWMAHGWTPGLQRRLLLPRHALHAAVLEIPWRDATLRWEAKLPDDLDDFCQGKEVAFGPEVTDWTRPASSTPVKK